MSTLLVNKFRKIKSNHSDSLIRHTAKVVLGPSVIRVFKADTKEPLKKVLSSIDVDKLRQIKSQESYKKWFMEQLNRVSKVIKTTNPQKERPIIYPGYKWGHASKILNLFVREIVENKRYFTDNEVKCIRPLLYVPIDRKVMDAMMANGCDPGVSKIKDIASKKQFFDIQDKLGAAALEANCSRIWFDDVWSIDLT